ncbi:hypothetical protein ACS0TY_016899 [Phlomoides rotata]
MQWEILRSPSWYSIKTANKIIMACCLLHNYIKKKMDIDPMEGDLDEYISNQLNEDATTNVDVIDNLDTTPGWTIWRDTIAQSMFHEWNNTV